MRERTSSVSNYIVQYKPWAVYKNIIIVDTYKVVRDSDNHMTSDNPWCIFIKFEGLLPRVQSEIQRQVMGGPQKSSQVKSLSSAVTQSKTSPSAPSSKTNVHIQLYGNVVMLVILTEFKQNLIQIRQPVSFISV